MKRLQLLSLGPGSQIKTCSDKGDSDTLPFKSGLNVIPRPPSLIQPILTRQLHQKKWEVGFYLYG